MSEHSVPTLKIKVPATDDNPLGYIVINEEDFEEGQEVFGEEGQEVEQAPLTKAQKAALEKAAKAEAAAKAAEAEAAAKAAGAPVQPWAQ